MPARRRLVISAFTALVLLIPLFAAQADTDSVDHANEFFERTWERTDLPVSTGQVNRTWMWGPGPNTGQMWEPYLESPDGIREVQYYDKSRMERNLTGAEEDSVWYVTNGLLVVEMVTGEIQVGEDTFEEHEPAMINVAGDPDGETSPTYAALYDLQPAVDDRGDEAITQIVDRHGNVTEDPGLEDQEVYLAHYDDVTGHNVAGPFWDFMTSSGLVYEDGHYVQGSMFLHPVYATGRPITEPYWAHLPVAGDEQWVLIQAFERRVLTFTPGNPEGWQVEAGNVGRHYFEWRYGYPVDHEPPEADDSADDGNGGPGPGNGNGTPPSNGDDGVSDDGVSDDGVADDGISDDDDMTDDNGVDDGVDDGASDDDDNGVDPPDSLGMAIIHADVDVGGVAHLTVDVQLNNDSDWEGPVDVELICSGSVVDSGVVNISAQGSATIGLSYQSDALLNIDFCTVNALIGGQVVASGTVAVASLLPDLLPDLNLSLSADANINVNGLLDCDAIVDLHVQLNNSNDYQGPVQLEVTGTSLLTSYSTTQTIQVNGPGPYPVQLQDTTISLLGLVSLDAQTYNAEAFVEGTKVGEATGTTASLSLPALCL